MEEKKYIVISLKHTRKTDDYFTLWGPDAKGYRMNEEQAGKYSESEINGNLSYYDNGDSTMAVLTSALEDKWVRVQENGHWYECLPNNAEIRKLLGIKKKQLK